MITTSIKYWAVDVNAVNPVKDFFFWRGGGDIGDLGMSVFVVLCLDFGGTMGPMNGAGD